ncbi:aa3-type cytochrome c oxidase subunit IV [uncultured Brevundimonas sp.]|uniref:aa3-type cytochrome c oxidase subunit IV n=1 Tax=uncultured Brevundimonas sp. TaxID=213418 RepID=UPI0030EC9ED4|tara:strand:+ start:3118 stop:3369 length:252 start_codon:yes stop_codon:yes gene_type:complete
MADPRKPTAAHPYVHGSQAIDEQKATFSLFITLSKWGSLAIAVLLTLLTLWFQPGGSFVPGFIAAAVLAVAGWFALRSKPAAH